MSSEAPLISQLLDLPEKVYKGDFVLDLTKGVTEPEKTAREYVVTPQLAACFNEALGFIRGALESRRSKAAYLHGSFGSGKSHFMAMLHLLLANEKAVREKPALAEVCIRNEWTRGKKFLLVPYHMIGKSSLRSAVLGGYVRHVEALHPDAPAPPVYIDGRIFENARTLRGAMGDEAFFAAISTGKDPKWGKLAQPWTAASFENAVASPAGSPERSRLASDLVATVLSAFRDVVKGKDEAFVELEDGLEAISRHAHGLGYDAVVLFLDELILWLASHAADAAFVEREGQSLVKLVEAQNSTWPAPIVSFIARQRDLRELVGRSMTGAEQLKFQDILQHWEDRFHTIKLEDRNLPVIARERVLRPRDEAAGARIETAFRETEKIRAQVMEILLTHEADRGIFQQVYPFSPAFIQALVAISSALQRERTALRILLEILIDQRETLRLGEIVPVGDLWDYVAADEAVSAEAMRVPFENARRIYSRKLQPLLCRERGVDPERDRERAAADDSVAEKLRLLRNDERIIKTLLLAAIVPEVEALRGLTAEKLAALNHGSIRAPLPGREGQVVLGKLRSWAQSVSEIRLGGDEGNPTAAIELSSVDTDAIIEAAKAYDSPGARQAKVRELLFEAMGIADAAERVRERKFIWRNTARTAELVFGNVREMPLDSLAQREEGWKAVIDFPFDQESLTARHDLDRVEEFRAQGQPARTLVWLPSFLSRKAQSDLGKLVILEHLLKGENTLASHSAFLSAKDRYTARGLLESQQAQLRRGLRELLEAAYGIRPAPAGGLDESDDLAAGHFHSLHPECRLRPPAAGSDLGAALDDLLRQAMEAQFPRHPDFERPVKPGDVRKVLEAARAAAAVDPPRTLVDQPERPILKQLANPLRLGRMSDDGYFVLGTEWRDRFNRKLHQSGKTHPTVGDLRSWIDDEPSGRYGLPEEVENLLVLVYAEQTNRTIFLHGGPIEGSIDRLPDEVELREARLPSPEVWGEARKRAGHIFGLAPGEHPTSAQVSRFQAELDKQLMEHQSRCERLPGLVAEGLGAVKAPAETREKAARLLTARAAQTLIGALAGAEGTERVEALARTTIASSAAAMGRSIKTAAAITSALLDTKWDLLQALTRLEDDRSASAHLILREVQEALAADEYNQPLAEVLRDAERRAVELLAPPPPKPESKPGWRVVDTITRKDLDASGLRRVTEDIAKQLQADPKARVEASWKLLKPDEKKP